MSDTTTRALAYAARIRASRTQDEAAAVYCEAMRDFGPRNFAPWVHLNIAISARWKGRTALGEVKRKAWKLYEQKPERTT